MMAELVSQLYSLVVKSFISATENGLIPDFVLRTGIRYLLRRRSRMVRDHVRFYLPDSVGSRQ